MLICLSQFLCTDLGVFCPYGRCSRREVRGWGGEGRAGETGEAGQPCYEHIARRAVRGGRHSASVQSHLQSNEAPSLPWSIFCLIRSERCVEHSPRAAPRDGTSSPRPAVPEAALGATKQETRISRGQRSRAPGARRSRARERSSAV